MLNNPFSFPYITAHILIPLKPFLHLSFHLLLSSLLFLSLSQVLIFFGSNKAMCSSKTNTHNSSTDHMDQIVRSSARINGRLVLQPTCNRVPERQNSLKKPLSPKKVSSITAPASKSSVKGVIRTNRISPSPPISPKTKSRKQQPTDHGLNSSIEKMLIPSKSSLQGSKGPSSPYLVVQGPPGSIATARREQVANMQDLRKMRIAHYGRRKNSAKNEAAKKIVHVDSLKRCSFITPNSDPVYVAYHDGEWGVPVYDDKKLFELLVLTTAQVGSDWTSVLKKRALLRDAFSGFDAEILASFGEKKIVSISREYQTELCHVRGAVDNANQILKIKKEFGSFSNYLWGFVNNKPITTNYKTCQKIPVKTSKSEAISKDLVKRGFRFVGPAVIHSFMQAAGLTNDHLVTCPRYLVCSQLHNPHVTHH